MEPPAEHRAQGPDVVKCFVLTVSDTRTPDTDTSGRVIANLVSAAGHVMTGHAIVRDEPTEVRAVVERELASRNVDVIITTGGTGVTSRDSTYEAVHGLLEKRLDGF